MRLEPLEPRLLLSGKPLITEFMASNSLTILDGNGATSDWIEIHNPTEAPISLAGWYLTDKSDNLTKWQFPDDPGIDTTLDPGEYMLVFASNRDDADYPYVDADDYLHTNFNLSKGGENVLLVEDDVNQTIAHSFVDYPPQVTDVSYGLSPDFTTAGYFFDSTPRAANVDEPLGDPDRDVVINEIMYHPAGDPDEDIRDEYIELLNLGPNAVGLEGWQLTAGVDFTFPDVSLAPGEFLVVAADPAVFAANYPTVTNYVPGSGWEGRLSNRSEAIELVDDMGRRVDRVEYADQGDWASRQSPAAADRGHYGWDWVSEHDGGGKSLELINAALPNQYGQNWQGSDTVGGTPGTANSVAAADLAPMIVDVSHFPVIPRSADTVTVTARLIDELAVGLTAEVKYRVDGDPTFTTVAMSDLGLSGDGAAGDGVYGVVLPAQSDGTVVEFYVKATDTTPNARTWPNPEPAPVQPNGHELPYLLYQVDDTFDPDAAWDPDNQPIYRLIMTEAERAELQDIGDSNDTPLYEYDSNAQMVGTFVSVDGTDVQLHYNVGIRNRGKSSRDNPPNNYRVNFPHDNPWEGATALNLNTWYPHLQIAGNAIFHMAGLAAAEGLPIQVRVNGDDLALSSGRMYGSYGYLEVYDADFADNQFPADGAGNVYKCVHHPWNCDLDYLGTDPQDYIAAGYEKKTNTAVNDWSDLINLTNVLTNAPDETYVADVAEVINVDQWLRWLAVHTLIGNGETNLGTGQGDDYWMYRGVEDPRFVLLPHDLDTVLGQGSGPAEVNDGILQARDVEVIDRFLSHPEFAPRYYAALLDLIETTFSPEQMNPLLDNTLGGYVPSATIGAMKQFVVDRNAYVLSRIPQEISAVAGLPDVDGFPQTTEALTPINGTAPAVETRSVLVNGEIADWSAIDATWSVDETTGSGGVWDALITGGAAAKYYVPTAGDAGLLPEPGDAGWTGPLFDDSGFTDTIVSLSSDVLITEVDTSDPNFVEIQNVSDAEVDTTGWLVLANEESLGINGVNATAWSLPTSVDASVVLYRTGDAGDNYWGEAIDWSPGGAGWVMIVDAGGNVMDFLAWGYDAAQIDSLDISYGGFASITPGPQWTGPGVAAAGFQAGAISYTGGTYTENFDSITDTGTAPPAGWIAGNYATVRNQSIPRSAVAPKALVPNDGSSSTKGVTYNYGTTGDPDRAIGSIATTNSGDRATQVAITNNTGSDITAFTLGYTGEQWRDNQATASTKPEKISVWFSTDPGSGFVDMGNAFDFAAPQDTGAETAIDGNDPANRTVISDSFTPAAPIAAGETFYITWHDINDNSTADHGLAIDDVSFTAVFQGGTGVHRKGNVDNNGAEDFLRAATTTKGTKNPDLTVPFAGDAPVTTGLGFSDGAPDYSSLIATDVAGEMLVANASLWTRIAFEVDDPAVYESLTLRMRYDDGFVAYLNGAEVASENAPVTLAIDSNATAEHSDSQAQDIDISASLAELHTGTNVLAIHGLNLTAADTDFLILPELIATGPLTSGLVLNPGINRVVVQAFDGPDGTGNEVDRGYIDIWYDDGSMTDVPLTAISSNTTWDAASGPYHVTGNITVDPGATLTILPGTTVFFDSGTGLTVNGRLMAEGTQYDRIHMTRVPGAANWQGIHFDGSLEDSRLSYIDMEYGDGQGESMKIDYSQVLIDNATWGGTNNMVIDMNHPSLILRNSYVPGISGGETIHGTYIEGDEYLILDGNIIDYNSSGGDVIDFLGAERPGPVFQVLNNIFLGGGDDGLDLDGTDAYIEGNVFMNFRKDTSRNTTTNAIATGLPQSGEDNRTEIFVVRNLFYNNDHAILLKEEAHATVINNTFVDCVLAVIQFDEVGGTSVEGPGKGAVLDGNIFWNQATMFKNYDHLVLGTDLTIDRSIVPPEWAHLGTGNIDEDPRLADPAGGNFSLLAGSPALGAGPNGLDIGGLVPAGVSIAGEPPAITAETGATFTFAGPGITHYKYRLDGSPWSAETAVDTPLVLAGLTDGPHSVDAVGKNREGIWQDENSPASKSWTVDSSLGRVLINEVLAINYAAVDHEGTFPDMIELYNDGAVAVDLGGMSISDDPNDPARFVFPLGTTLPGGDYLVLYADDNAITSGTHLGFGLDGLGEGVYLFDTVANGQGLVDSIEFGLQLADLSIGRVGRTGSWALTQPTLGDANVAQRTGDPAALKINEWFANGEVRFVDDFVELYNGDPLPVPLGGLVLTDEPVAVALSEVPAARAQGHVIPALSFIAGGGFRAFEADANTDAGNNHANFRLSADQEMIGLLDADLNVIDQVIFDSQTTDFSQGRRPDGGDAYEFFRLPTRGLAGSTSTVTELQLIEYVDQWSYYQAGNEPAEAPPGTNWYEPGFDDSAWAAGPGLLYVEGATLPEPKNTPLTLGANAYYFRTHFTFDADPADLADFSISAVLDDGAVLYLNGQEVMRIGVEEGIAVDYTTPADRTINNAGYEGPYAIPEDKWSALLQGDNVIAVEVHQTNTGSSDVVFGLSLDATVVTIHDELTAEGIAQLDGLRISELMYNPAGDDDAEFIEIVNISPTSLSVDGIRLTGAVDFTFPDMMLAAGERVVVVRDRDAFELRYGSGGNVIGQYSGNLSNGGENLVLRLAEPLDAGVLRFGYDDAWYPDTDGGGYALEIRDLNGRAAGWDDGENWQAGAVEHGTPGTADGQPDVRVVINEILAHSNEYPDDWFEIYNPTAEPIDVGGWYVSDDEDDLTKYRIAADTEIPAGGYLVLTQDDNFGPGSGDPGSRMGFAFSEHGDQAFLSSGIDGKLGGYRRRVEFGVSPDGMSFGRHAMSTGMVDFALLTATTSDDVNDPPFIGDLVISEVEYHPADPTAAEIVAGFTNDGEFEFIELYNRTGSPIDLTEYYVSDAVGLTFGWYDVDGLDTAVWTLESGATATWAASLPESGDYELLVYVGNDDLDGGTLDLDSTAKYEFVHTAGTEVVLLDQNAGAGGWASLGTFSFAGGSTSVTLTRGTTLPGERTVADQIKFVKDVTEVIVDDGDPGFSTTSGALTTVPAGASVVVVSNYDAFDYRYDVAANGISVAGQYTGQLDNGGEEIELLRAIAPELNGFIPYYLVDQVRYDDVDPWPAEADGNGNSLQRTAADLRGNDPASWTAAAPGPGDFSTTSTFAQVVGRYIFYNNSAYDATDDDAAIAPDPAGAGDPGLGKEALMPGGTANFQNYTAYSRGINGIMVDFQDLPDGVTELATADFTFKTGNDNDPDNWPAAPDPADISLRFPEGQPARATIIWTDGEIKNEWLQVTVNVTASTGLENPHMFYFGNSVGEVGDAGDGLVTYSDLIQTRNDINLTLPVGIDSKFDFDRSRYIDYTDLILCRNNINLSTGLNMITVPALPPAAPEETLESTVAAPAALEPDATVETAVLHDAVLEEAPPDSTVSAASLAELAWFYDQEQQLASRRPSAQRTSTAAAVDELMTVF